MLFLANIQKNVFINSSCSGSFFFFSYYFFTKATLYEPRGGSWGGGVQLLPGGTPRGISNSALFNNAKLPSRCLRRYATVRGGGGGASRPPRRRLGAMPTGVSLPHRDGTRTPRALRSQETQHTYAITTRCKTIRGSTRSRCGGPSF